MPDTSPTISEHDVPDHVEDLDNYAPLKLDYDAYNEDLSESEITLEQKNAFLEAMWHIMGTFVQIGWGVEHTTHLFPEIFENSGGLQENMVEQKDNI